MPELSLSKRFAGSRRIQLSSFEFSADQIEAVKRLIGRSIGEVECERIWPISVAAVLPPQSYSGFRSALCGTRSTDTLDVEKHCQIERPWSSARFGSQADKTADWVARTGVRMRLFCLIVLWLRDDRELSAGGLLFGSPRAEPQCFNNFNRPMTRLSCRARPPFGRLPKDCGWWPAVVPRAAHPPRV
jgi:hypothetical protein